MPGYWPVRHINERSPPGVVVRAKEQTGANVD